MRYLAVLLSSLLAAEGLQAATYYVAKTGRDSNPGTLSSPFLTIKKGVSALKSGDTLYVRAGTYAEYFADGIASGSSWSSPTTLAAYPGERVVIAPSSGARVFQFKNARYIVLDGFVLDGRNVTANVIKIMAPARHIRVKNSEAMNAPGQGILVAPDAPYNEFINLKVHHNGGSRGDLDHGFYIESDGNLIERCDIYANAGKGIQIYNGYAGKTANKNVVRYNKIHDNARLGQRGVGMILSSGSGNVAHTNLIWNNAGGIQVDYGAVGAKVYNNTIYKNNGYAIYLGKGTADNNSVPSSGALVRNNILYANTSGITNVMPGTTVSNNLIADPLFANAAAFDFRLRSGSPAIDAGVSLSGEGIATDFAGSPRPLGAAFDIGAYEYAGSATAPAAPAPGCQSVSSAWKNVSIPSQTGSFTFTVTATPSAAKMDGLIGLSHGAATGYSSLAAGVRFNTSGGIDARSGGAYTAAASIPYSPNLPYTFRLAVDIAARRYSAYVRQGANAERLIGSNLAFRTEQAAVKTLNNAGLFASAGSQTVCAPVVSGSGPAADTTAPVISAIAAAGITSSGASISWTTNEPADTQVEYGLTTAYGASTPLNATLSTSHVAVLSGLKAGTLHHYRVKSKDAAGNLAVSSDRTLTTASSCQSVSSAWVNVPFAPKTGPFTVTFDATPSQSGIDGVMGLSNGPASSYTSLAAAVRFNNAGRIDARSGGGYTASTSISYSASVSYRFRLVVDPAAKRYSAYVKQGANAERLIGSNLAFRAEQAGTGRLSNLGLHSSIGRVTVCNASAN